MTQGQWQQVMGTTPWKGETWAIEGSDVAASYISWDDVVEFCQKLSRKEGRRYRLPTEAEWEYVCRAGTTTRFSFGDDESQLGSMRGLTEMPTIRTKNTPHRVGQKKPNAFGLYDMHGNVWEWCADWYEGGYYKSSAGADPQGPSSGSFRVLRGGSWYSGPIVLRSSFRHFFTPGYRNYNTGCRVVLECG
ncbi:MAG UNVERIFIED_CONTAM: formylglycine-generating enzyme family protein [Planctomycetaceae bacterium]